MKKAYRKPEVYEERISRFQRVSAGGCEFEAELDENGALPMFPGFVLFVSAENAFCTVDPDEDKYCVELAGSDGGMQLFGAQ